MTLEEYPIQLALQEFKLLAVAEEVALRVAFFYGTSQVSVLEHQLWMLGVGSELPC